MNIFQKNSTFFAGLALVLISGALLLRARCNETEVFRLKWKPFCEAFRDRGFVPVIKGQTAVLTRYTIKAALASGKEKWMSDDFAIQFCDRYSLNLVHGKAFVTSLADAAGKAAKTVVLEGVPANAPVSFQSRKLKLLLECDLVKRTVGIYINGAFIKNVFLGSETLHYAVDLKGAYVYLLRLKIADDKGRILFNWNVMHVLALETLGYWLLLIGGAIPWLLIFYEMSFWRRAFLIVLVLLSVEGFLRNVKFMDPDYNINVAKYEWNFRTETNLFGEPDPDRLLSKNTSGFSGERSHGMKPEGGRRIIIIGPSPVGGVFLHDPEHKAFPALLRKKLNPGGGNNVSVIVTAFLSTNMQSLQSNIYLTDVLLKLNPDLVVFYGAWDGKDEEIRKEQLLYQRARKILAGNSDWIVSNRLLYAALEFNNPVKEIVYLYNSLCESYIFMRLENARKRVFNRWCCLFPARPAKMAGAYFEKMVRMCRENKIKLLLMPEVDFDRPDYGGGAEESIRRITREHPEVYVLGLQRLFLANKGHGFSFDANHPNECGHRIFAEEIFRKIMRDDLLGIKSKEKSHGTQGR